MEENIPHRILIPLTLKVWVRRPAALGLRLATRAAALGKKRAIAAVARKLAVDLHDLWKSEEVYRPRHLLDKCFEEADIGRRNIYPVRQ